MIYLSEKDIAELADFESMMDQIEKAFRIYEEKRFHMPDRWHIDRNGLTALYMPCFLDGVYGSKILSVVPDNHGKGRPVIDGLMLLNDASTGEILCLLEGSVLTALRTGAVGGVGARYLSPEETATLGIIGAGIQGYYQALFACKARPIRSISILDVVESSAVALKDRLETSLGSGIDIRVTSDASDLLETSELIITATTANAPVLPNDIEKLRGKHFIGIGSYKPNMKEYPGCIFDLIDKVYIDQVYAIGESGDLIDPLSQHLIEEDDIECFSSYLIHEEKKEEISRDTTFFKSVGMALFDVVTAEHLFKKAEETGSGTKLR